MKRLKKVLRFILLVFLILIASMGIGAPISMNMREKYMNYEVKTEQVEDKKEDEESELKDVS